MSFGAGGFTCRRELDDVPPPAPAPHSHAGWQGQIPTASVAALSQMSPDDALRDVEARTSRTNLFTVYLCVAGVLLVFALVSAAAFIALFIVFGVGAVFVYRWDRQRRTARILYDIDNDEIVTRVALCNAAGEALARTAALWHVYSSVAAGDRKYHGGAGTLLQRTATRSAPGSFPGIELNIEPWAIAIGPQQLLFLPDRLLVREGKRYAAVPYEWLSAVHETTRFLEDGAVPPDSQLVEMTWRFVNKSGGPDRRFNDNRQIPVLAYGELTLRSGNGIQVVLQANTDHTEKSDGFDVSPETDEEEFDAAGPLSGRWIRCWPWPYGAQKKTRLADAAAASAVGCAVAQRKERERVRLLYVGFTRARDHLVLAARSGSNGPAVRWLKDLCDAHGKPVLELPADPNPSGKSEVVVRDRSGRTSRVPARHWVLGPPAAERGDRIAPATCLWPARPSAPAPRRPPYWVAPSRAAVDWPELAVPDVADIEVIGDRLPLGSARDVDWDVVGAAIHAFLAADVYGLSLKERLTRAEHAVASAGLAGLLTAEGLLGTGDRLRVWVDTRWRGARWHRELPVSAALDTPLGRRRIEGTIDLLLETPQGAVIIDHKSFPGPRTAWRDHAREHAPQLQAYTHVVEAAGIPVIGKWLHFAVGAGAVGLR